MWNKESRIKRHSHYFFSKKSHKIKSKNLNKNFNLHQDLMVKIILINFKFNSNKSYINVFHKHPNFIFEGDFENYQKIYLNNFSFFVLVFFKLQI